MFLVPNPESSGVQNGRFDYKTQLQMQTRD